MLNWIAVAYGAMSIMAFAAFWWDKRSARLGRRRIAENSLHLLELLGGFPGALAAQHLLRHKNRKLGYRVTLWCIVALHALGWTLWLAA